MDFDPTEGQLDPEAATARQYLKMKLLARTSATELASVESPVLRSIVEAVRDWTTDWVEQWEHAHRPGEERSS